MRESGERMEKGKKENREEISDTEKDASENCHLGNKGVTM